MPKEPIIQATAPQPALGCLVRLFWMAFGNVALLLAGLEVVRSNDLGNPDIAYGAIVLALLLARYIDVTRLNGMTSKAEPATRDHLYRYAIQLVAFSTIGWLVARLVSAAG